MTRAALDAGYNNGLAVVDSPAWLEKWRDRSNAIRAGAGARLNVQYGPHPRESLDYFSSGGNGAPLFVFIHGGYWQRNEKELFSFVSDGPRQHGIDVAVVGYTLAPDASLTEIVAEIDRSLTFLADLSNGFSFDRKRVIIGGWSAGGHLTASASSHPLCAGTLPISGIFDLEPIALSYINDKLRLSPREIKELSPLKNVSVHKKPCFVAVGAAELPELRRQSQLYADFARSNGVPVTLQLLPEHNHFSILGEFSDKNGVLAQALLELVSMCSGQRAM
jgi:arylformamidase